MNSPTKEEVKKSDQKIQGAFDLLWRVATNQARRPDDRALMSIPPDHERDVDIILQNALDELFRLRNSRPAEGQWISVEEVEKLRLEIKLLKQEVAEMSVALHKAEEDLQYE